MEKYIKNAKKWLRKIANIDLKQFSNTINEVAHEHKKIIIVVDKKKPRTKEQRESERKWIEEQKQIQEYKDKYEGEILAFTRRGDELVLVAHGLTEKVFYDNIDEAVKNGSFDNKTERMFYR